MTRILFSLQWFIYAETHVALKITHNFKPESKKHFHFSFFVLPQNKIRMRKPSKESCISSLTLLYGKETFPWYVWNKNSDTKYFLWISVVFDIKQKFILLIRQNNNENISKSEVNQFSSYILLPSKENSYTAQKYTNHEQYLKYFISLTSTAVLDWRHAERFVES